MLISLSACAQTGITTKEEDAPFRASEGQSPTGANPEDSVNNTRGTGKPSIVCVIFPQYDWVREILGERSDRFDLTLLVDTLVDLHNYQPSVSDIIRIGTCDLFIHVGGNSDGWVDDVLKQSANPDMIVLNLIEVIGDAVKMELILEGMEHDCDDDCDDLGHNHDGDHVHEDEHVWLSLRFAKTICAAITDVLSELDPDNAGYYSGNLTAYTDRLTSLDMEYQAAADAANVTTLVFADRFPFRYMMDDYGLGFYAAFSGCSAETEASFSTIVFLATKVEELVLNHVMVTESADQSLARTVINSTPRKSQQILVLNAMQSVTRRDIDNGATYLSIMESNLAVLREALG